MRKLLGGVVLVGGVAGLGWYASQGPAVDIEDQIEAAAAAVAGTAQHGIDAVVSGRDITISGTVDDAAEQDALLAAFEAIPGRRVVNAASLETLPFANPFFFSLSKTSDGLNAMGNVPSAAIAEDLGFEGLTVANGEPDENWADAIKAARAALDPLKSASVAVAGSDLAVTGVAADPDALAAYNDLIGALPEGYTATSDITVEDDGTPLRLSLEFDGTTLSGSGKIPSDLSIDDVAIDGIATALDLQEASIPSADGNWPAFAEAALSALGALNEGALSIDGQVGTISGVGDPDGIDAATQAVADLPEGYSVETAFTLFDDGRPFALTAEKTRDGIAASGKVPADFASDVLAAPTNGLDVAFITDETGTWPGIATAGLAALNSLEAGQLDVTSEGITLSGDAANPDAQAAVEAALAGYPATLDVALLDDGAPLSLTLTYSADAGAAVSGKLPNGLTPSSVAEVLELEVTDAGATEASGGAGDDFLGPLGALRDFLPELSGLTYVANESAVSVEARTVPGVDPEQIGAEMQAALGDTVDLSVAALTDLPAQGSTRVNRFSGREEVFTSGFWLPTFDFFPTPESCAEQSEIILATDKVQFVTGSADLDVQSIRAINALAALALKCAVEGGVFLQVAGHTDNTGDPEANLALSQARADAVRNALLDRGLARVVVTAIGYGDTQPIADNDTEEGRAQNRRTAFNWNFE